MNKPAFIPLIMLIFFIGMPGLFAQKKDACLWISAEIEKKITPRWSLHFTEEVRMNENITEVGQIHSEIGVTFKAWTKWKFGATYRFAQQRRIDDSYRTRQRFYADVTYREKIRPVILLLRARYQSGYADILYSERPIASPDHLNLKLTARYDLKKKYEPYISSEWFFRLNRIQYHSFDQIRVTAGVVYSFNRMHEIDLYYRINKEFNVARPETDYIIGIGYHFTF